MQMDTPARKAQRDDIVTEPLPDIIDHENFTPRLLALLSNAMVWRESQELRRRYGLGTNDWRVLSAVAIHPGITATGVTDFLGVNKAVVSKSTNVLVNRDLIALWDGPRGSRPMYLTKAGAEMHDLMLPISLRGQDIVRSAMTAAEISHLNELLRQMIDETRRQTTSDSEAAARRETSAR